MFEAPIAFELALDRIIPVGEDHLVLGVVKQVYIDPDVFEGDFKIAIDAWKPVASLAGNFAGLTPVFSFGKK